MSARFCRYDRMAHTLAAIDGVVLPDVLNPCDDRAAVKATVVRADEGVNGAIFADLCTSHGLLVSAAQGYMGWIELERAART